MKSYRNITATMLAGLLLMGLSACEKGPAEKAGEAIDDAASDVADVAEDAASDVADAAEDAADAVEEKIDK
ncbi:MAG: hypothetical protein OEU63_03660 [Gammaproteobacteria bacterium]|nr:hypothetical protein [Gammaproteobacteria bacterium]